MSGDRVREWVDIIDRDARGDALLVVGIVVACAAAVACLVAAVLS